LFSYFSEHIDKDPNRAYLASKIKIDDFTVYTPDLLQRCVYDCFINLKLYRFFKKYLDNPSFKDALKTEHFAAKFTQELHDNGFALDIKSTENLYQRLIDRLEKLDAELKTDFPPSRQLRAEIVAREVKSGAVHASDFRRLIDAGYSELDIVPNRTYQIWETVEFNPASSKQVIDRLWDAGWKPTEKTKGHKELLKQAKLSPEDLARLERFKRYGWTLSEENLLTLPSSAPASIQRLVERMMLASKVATLRQWLEAVKWTDGVPRVHGTFNAIGAWTHRGSHTNPNMGNIPKVQDRKNPSPIEELADNIAKEMRSQWIAPPGRVLIGVDADGIQMRIFAHYAQSPILVEALINGKKENKTDIHSLHQRALGEACKGRDPAKTFIYAWLLGAGIHKVAEILDCSLGQARQAVEQFLEFYPALKDLKKTQIPADAKRGYFLGLDKRPVICDNMHLMLAGYLQNGEAVIMKRAAREWTARLQQEKLPYKVVNWVHDEWVTEVPDDHDLANYIADIQIEALVRQGLELELRCPLAGTKKIGNTWYEVH
jgi:DNA polymerase-1